jgi:hypothetical protein
MLDGIENVELWMISFLWFSKIVVCLIYKFICLAPFASVLSSDNLKRSPARNKLLQHVSFPQFADAPHLPS